MSLKSFAGGLMLCLALFSFSGLLAQDTPVSSSPTTTISFTEDTYNFGKINEGELVSHTYVFTNTGDQPLIISNARGSCGCTVPQWPREPIAPGQSAEIIVEFNSKNKKGKRNQKVTIEANTNPRESFIYLTGEVMPKNGQIIAPPVTTESDWFVPEPYPVDAISEPPVPTGPITTLEFQETTFDFGAVEEGEIIQHVFTFTNTGDEMLVLSDAKGSCGCTVPDWPRYPIAPGETASITVNFNSKNKKGRRNQKVTVTANTSPPQSFVYMTGEVIPSENWELEIPDFTAEPESEEEDLGCIAVFPNPTADILNLDLSERIGKSAIISIYSKSGALMAEREIEQIEGNVSFDVSHYPAGTYYAHIQVVFEPKQTQCFIVARN